MRKLFKCFRWIYTVCFRSKGHIQITNPNGIHCYNYDTGATGFISSNVDLNRPSRIYIKDCETGVMRGPFGTISDAIEDGVAGDQISVSE